MRLFLIYPFDFLLKHRKKHPSSFKAYTNSTLKDKDADTHMPSFVGVFKVVSNAGSFINGDTLVVSPNSSTKSYTGSGSFVTGDFTVTNTLFSATVTSDRDVVDTGANKVATGT
jgi:spore germination protein PF